MKECMNLSAMYAGRTNGTKTMFPQDTALLAISRHASSVAGNWTNCKENKTGIIFMPLQTITQLKEALPWRIFTEKSRDRHGLQQRA